jgi:cell wall-associated NlpC family hydrolase
LIRLKKAITALGIGAVAIAVNTVDASALQKGVVTAGALNIRSNPSIDSAKVGLAYKGASVEILDKSNGWYKVKVSNSLVGWGSAQYISLDSSAGSNSGSSSGSSNNGGSTAQSGNGKVAVGSRLNVRSGPGTNYGIVGKANNGEVLQLLELSNGWYKVKLSNGTVGWVTSQYIVKTNESVGSGSNSGDKGNSGSTNVQGKKGKIRSGIRLNVRSGAGTGYSVVGKLNGGDVVQLLELKSGWYKVKMQNGTTGWVSGDYVSETNESPNEGGSNGSGNNNNNNNNGNGNNGGTSGGQTPSYGNGAKVVDFAYTLIGIPYQWGANGPNSFDCSGFTKYVYEKSVGVSIPRVSKAQASYGSPVSMGNYAQGDLVYFDTDGDGVTNHVGIYLGNSKFIHCSGTQTNPNKVKVDSLTGSYWSKALLGARRII